MSSIDKKWYVLRAIGGKELKAKENIETEIKNRGLEDYFGQILVPVEKVVSERNGKKVVKENVLYNGYIFVECALDGDVAAVLTNVPNVINFLAFLTVDDLRWVSGPNGERVQKAVGKKQIPQPMRPAEVARMIGHVDENAEEVPDSGDLSFSVGESVKVAEGPFSGFSGVIEEVFEDKKKLAVSVKIFGRKTPLELAYTQVEKE